MPDTQDDHASQPASDPITPISKGKSWSKEDTFKLLEELLEARRNRELLHPSDRSAVRVFEDIAETLQRLHPSNLIWNAKRVRNKHDDMASLYEKWYIASNYSGCHADRKTGQISYDAEESKNKLITRYGTIMQRVFRNGLLCSDTFNLDHYDEVFANVTATGKKIGEIDQMLQPTPKKAETTAAKSQGQKNNRQASPSPQGPSQNSEALDTETSDFEEEDDSADPFASLRAPAQARGRSKRAAPFPSITVDQYISLLHGIRSKRPKHETSNSESPGPEQSKLELAVRDVARFAQEHCGGLGTSIVEWLSKDKTGNPALWLALETDTFRLAFLEKIGVSILD
ncbi:uncharacterized protein CPUR_01625 [Claviceps purpurea 20.1]|uniref:Myb/SANT-like domain-containing protein n=1 Tax=Claviceps purpurea (strain 20.1) TaxID=1111077 RepID=M1VZI1_CLAP2|nr:uncharacterized protein CPUR_01625 [Claviceps purpurea 20.1]